VAVIVPRDSENAVFMIDATPDFPEQLAALADVRAAPAGKTDRAPLEGILLTHAHVGHYLGLAQLGFEVLSTKDIPVHATPKMAEFLRTQGPWSQLVDQHNISLVELTAGSAFELAPKISATALLVPHRDEFSDTVAFVIAGERKKLLFVPDTDPWARWPSDPLRLFEGIDVALVDGTFHSMDELPGRDIATIGHPLMVDTMELLQARVDEGSLDVWFLHLNHSNPALDPESAERREIERRGFAVAHAGLEIEL
jgi:pyrroloquinoline quinone biosynthesis protein B